MKVEVVEFLDTTTFDFWMDEAESRTCKTCVAVGWLVGEDTQTVRLALLRSDDGVSKATVAAIPKGAILKRKVIYKDKTK